MHGLGGPHSTGAPSGSVFPLPVGLAFHSQPWPVSVLHSDSPQGSVEQSGCMGELHSPGIQDGAEVGERHPEPHSMPLPLPSAPPSASALLPHGCPRPCRHSPASSATIGIVPLLLPHPRAVSVCVDSHLQGAPCYSVGVPSSALCTAEAASPACLGPGMF